MKLSLIFPGQGAQYVGMGKSLYENYPEVKELYNEANDVLGFDIANLSFEGPEDKIQLTEFTQPLILTHSIALYTILKNKITSNIDSVLGHSVGEYAALVASGALSFEDAVKSVNARGKFMQTATELGVGAMYAIVRLDSDIIERACKEASNEKEIVTPANFNEPNQTVISGHTAACERAVEWLKNNIEQRHMAIPLKVSAPFHSPLMIKAQQELKSYLKDIEFSKNDIDYIANIDAKRYEIGTEEQLIKENLVHQVSGSVLWKQSIQKFKDDQVFIEVGPGKVLTGLNKKINKSLRTFTMDQPDFESKLEEFLNDCNL